MSWWFKLSQFCAGNKSEEITPQLAATTRELTNFIKISQHRYVRMREILQAGEGAREKDCFNNINPNLSESRVSEIWRQQQHFRSPNKAAGVCVLIKWPFSAHQLNISSHVSYQQVFSLLLEASWRSSSLLLSSSWPASTVVKIDLVVVFMWCTEGKYEKLFWDVQQSHLVALSCVFVDEVNPSENVKWIEGMKSRTIKLGWEEKYTVHQPRERERRVS